MPLAHSVRHTPTEDAFGVRRPFFGSHVMSLTVRSILLASLSLFAIACGSSSTEGAASETDNIQDDSALNKCRNAIRCKELSAYNEGLTPPRDIADNIGTFALSAEDGPHRSPICELVLQGVGKHDDELKKNVVVDRRYRMVMCGSKEVERGEYKIIESDETLRYIEFKSEGGKVTFFGFGHTPAKGDLRIQNWYYANDDDRKNGKASFDAWDFVRAGAFYCDATADCDGQSLGCFRERVTAKVEGSLARTARRGSANSTSASALPSISDPDVPHVRPRTHRYLREVRCRLLRLPRRARLLRRRQGDASCLPRHVRCEASRRVRNLCAFAEGPKL